MTILFLTKDLLIQSNASAASKPVGIKIVAVGSVEQLLEKLVDETVSAIFVDLQTPGLHVSDLIEQLEKTEPRIRTFAFAQHVYESLLESARGDTFEAVLTRGQFVNRLPKLVQDLAS